jgi:hypothetical protein
LLLLPLALSYKFDRKEDLIKEKLALHKHISNSIDHGPAYKSRVKGVHHGSVNKQGLLGHRGEHHDIRINKKQKQKFGHRGEHHQPANTKYDNDDINLQRLDNVKEVVTKKTHKLRKPKSLKKQNKKKLYKKLYKEKYNKFQKYKKHSKKY